MPNTIDDDDGDRSISTREVARLVGMTPGGLAEIRRRGGGPPYYRIGGRVRYRLADVRAWIASRTVGR